MTFSSIMLGVLVSASCFEVLDDQDIAAARDVFVGVPLAAEDGQIEVGVVLSYRMSGTWLELGDLYALPGETRDEIGWREIGATIEHRDPGYLISESFYGGMDFDDFSDGCDVRYDLVEGVLYMFVLGSEAKLRSVEPITSTQFDPWALHVDQVLELEEAQ